MVVIRDDDAEQPPALVIEEDGVQAWLGPASLAGSTLVVLKFSLGTVGAVDGHLLRLTLIDRDRQVGPPAESVLLCRRLSAALLAVPASVRRVDRLRTHRTTTLTEW